MHQDDGAVFQIMSRGGDRLHILRVSFHPSIGHEEAGACVRKKLEYNNIVIRIRQQKRNEKISDVLYNVYNVIRESRWV